MCEISNKNTVLLKMKAKLILFLSLFCFFFPSLFQSRIFYCLPLSISFFPSKDPADSGGDIPDPHCGYSGREGV